MNLGSRSRGMMSLESRSRGSGLVYGAKEKSPFPFEERALKLVAGLGFEPWIPQSRDDEPEVLQPREWVGVRCQREKPVPF